MLEVRNYLVFSFLKCTPMIFVDALDRDSLHSCCKNKYHVLMMQACKHVPVHPVKLVLESYFESQ